MPPNAFVLFLFVCLEAFLEASVGSIFLKCFMITVWAIVKFQILVVY